MTCGHALVEEPHALGIMKFTILVYPFLVSITMLYTLFAWSMPGSREEDF